MVKTTPRVSINSKCLYIKCVFRIKTHFNCEENMQPIYPTNAINYMPQSPIKGAEQTGGQNGIQIGVETSSGGNDDKEKAQQKRKQRIGKITFASGLVFLLLFFLLVLYDYISLSGGFTEADLKTFSQKFEFTLRYQVLGLFPIAAIVQYIALRRVLGSAVDPTDTKNQHLVEKSKNILQNSLEQYVMSAMAQLILTTNLSAESVLIYCPFMSVTLFIGRVCFIVTYPNYRGFAFAVSFTPTFLAIVYSLLNVMI